MSTPRNKEICDFHNAPPRTSKLLRRREIQAMQHGGASWSHAARRAGARCKNPSRLRKSSIPVGSGAYSRPSLSLRCSSLLFAIVVTLGGRQSMARSKGLDETVNEHRFRNSSPRDYRSQRRNQIRKCSVILRRQRNTKTSLPRLRRGPLLFLCGSPFDYQFVQKEDFSTES